jgi:hypothetical protein
MPRTATPPVVGLVFGIALTLWAIYTGMHSVHLLLEGEATHGVIAAIEHRRSGRHSSTWSVIHADGGTCAVEGVAGVVGQRVEVHHARGNPSDCAVDVGLALRRPLLFTVIGLGMIVTAYVAIERARRRGAAPS